VKTLPIFDCQLPICSSESCHTRQRFGQSDN
jgi:hypothetical protein